MDDGEVEIESCQNYMKEVEVIGGDLSEFEVGRGVYYLCRRDFFKSMSPDWLKKLVGGTFHYTELQGWRKARQRQNLYASYEDMETFRHSIHLRVTRMVLKVDIRSQTIKRKVMKAVSALQGIDSIEVDTKDGKLSIIGKFCPIDVVYYVRKIVTVKIMTVDQPKDVDKKHETGVGSAYNSA